jgi:endonuclease/exonuclease/phosphatase family metal-dependent hydrolase
MGRFIVHYQPVSGPEGSVHLKVVTYNIHRAIGVDRLFRPDRIVEVVEHHQPDIVLMQEVDEGAPRSRELDLARELAVQLDYPHYAVGHNVSLRKGRYGNATLSRYPILRERNIDLTIEGRKRRGCQHTTIRIEKVAGHTHDLEVFNLHLGLSARERARQIGVLARSGEFAKLDSALACLVGGDFNDWRSLLHPIFTEIFDFRCATQRDYGYNGAIRTYPSFSPTGGLDKLYFRGPMRMLWARSCRLRLARVASDHLPIIAQFEIS